MHQKKTQTFYKVRNVRDSQVRRKKDSFMFNNSLNALLIKSLLKPYKPICKYMTRQLKCKFYVINISGFFLT